MQLNLTGKNFKITPAIKIYAEEKFEPLLKRYNQITNIHVILNIEHIENIAEANVHFHGSEINAKASAKDMYIAIEDVIEKLSAQLHKHKEKIIDSNRESS